MQAFMSPEMQQWLRRSDISAILMVEMDFKSGPLLCHSGVGDAQYQGRIFKGTGVLGKVGPVKQDGKVKPSRLRFTLSGIPQELVSLALGEQYQNRFAALYLAALDPYGNIQARDTLFAGRMDVMNVRVGQPSTIALDINSRGVDWKNPRNSRYTHSDQQAKHIDDDFFNCVSQMAEKEINWGVPGRSISSGGGGRGNSRSRQQHR